MGATKIWNGVRMMMKSLAELQSDAWITKTCAGGSETGPRKKSEEKRKRTICWPQWWPCLSYVTEKGCVAQGKKPAENRRHSTTTNRNIADPLLTTETRRLRVRKFQLATRSHTRSATRRQYDMLSKQNPRFSCMHGRQTSRWRWRVQASSSSYSSSSSSSSYSSSSSSSESWSPGTVGSS